MSSSILRNQWEHPTGILSVLLIVRGDVIQKALAQLAGGPFHITPVAFSFGWVSYGVTTLLSAIGEGRLMPEVDCPSVVINANEGSKRTNGSWVLGRILRDWEISSSYDYTNPALVVAIFKVDDAKEVRDNTWRKAERSDVEKNKQQYARQRGRLPGVPVLDRVWYIGIMIMIVQCVTAAVATIIQGSWLILIVTVAGTLLALAGGALPQWRGEKWACRKLEAGKHGVKNPKTTVLTRGNGHRHVMIIIDKDGTGLNLEDLAAGRFEQHKSTLPLVLALAIFWIVLLLTVGNIPAEDAWYITGIGSLGMAQNLFTAGHHRKAEAFGIHLSQPEYVLPEPSKKDENGKEICNKVFQVLKKTESTMSDKHGIRRVGIFLLPLFFPNGLRPHEIEWQKEEEAKYDEADQTDQNERSTRDEEH